MGRGGSQGGSIKSFVSKYLEGHTPAIVDRQVLATICQEAERELRRDKPVSRAYVLDILSETQIPIDRSLGGLPPDLRRRVHFHDEDATAASLSEMTSEYEAARSAGDKIRAADCRRAVRKGKDRLKLVLRRPKLSPQKRAEKEELLQWFLVWLEAPPLFPGWLELRRKSLHALAAGEGYKKTAVEAKQDTEPNGPDVD
jgi:hypothetical protein